MSSEEFKPQFTHQLGLCVVVCVECGITFAAPSSLLRIKARDDKTVFCPNGHESYWGLKKEAVKRDILAIHEAEQAEARAAEGKPRQRHADDLPVFLERVGKSVSCPFCDRSYRGVSAHFANHLRDAHQCDEHTASAILTLPQRDKEATNG